MDNTFDRILTRSRRRLSVESSDMRDDDNLSNVGTPTKKPRNVKRLSKLEDVQEGNSSPPKTNETENEANTPAKSLRGRRSLALTVVESPKPDVAKSPVPNLRRSQRHSPVGSDKSPSDNVIVSAGVEDDTESLLEKKVSSPSKNMLLKKDILSAHNTFDSPKPKKNQKGKNEPSVTPNPRRSRRLSTELNIVQEDPIKEEEVDTISLKSVAKTRRGKRLSIAPLQPSLPEEIEEHEITNIGNKSNTSIVKDVSFKTKNCSVNVIEIMSPNKSINDKSITNKSNKSGSENSFNESKLKTEVNKSFKEGSKSPKKMADKSIHLDTEKSINMDKSLKLNNSHISESDNTKSHNKSNKSGSENSFNESKLKAEVNKSFKEGCKSPKKMADKSIHLDTEKSINMDKSLKLNYSHMSESDNTKSHNKSMSDLVIEKSRDTSNVSSTSLKEYSLRKHGDKSANFNASNTVLCEAEKIVDKDCSMEKLNSSKSSDKSLKLMNNSTANQSKKRDRKSSSFVVIDNSKCSDNDNSASDLNKSTPSDSNSSLKNLSRKSTRKSNANDIQNPLDVKDKSKISDVSHMTDKNISVVNISTRSSRRSSSQPMTPENNRKSGVLNTSHPADGEVSPANSSKRNRKSAKDFFSQDTPNENSPDSKSFMNASKNRGTNIGDVATSTPNIFGKEVVSKAHLMKATTINLFKKNESLNNSHNVKDVSKTKKNDSKLIEELHMSVTEYMPSPTKNSKDKNVSKIDKQVSEESDEDEESIKLTFLDSASEAESNYQSGDSMNESEREEIEDNKIVEKGETLGTESSESESESCSNDSFVCSDEPEENLLSGTGDDLSSGDDELTQSKASKIKYNLKQMKKQKDSSKEMFEARHSMSNNSKVNSSSSSSKKYKKIMNVSSPSSDSEETEYMDVDTSIPDPLSATVCMENSHSHSKSNIKIIDLDDSEGITKSPSKKTGKMNESQKNETRDPLSTTVTGDGNKSGHLNKSKNISMVADEHDSESLSSLSEGEEIKNITSIYEKQLKELHEINASQKKDNDSSSDEESEIEQIVDNVKSPNHKSNTLNLTASKSPKLGSSFKDSTINSVKSPSVSKVVDEKVKNNMSLSLKKDDDSSSDENEESEIEKNVGNAKSPNRKSNIGSLSVSKSPKLGSSFKDSTVNSVKSPSVSRVIDGEVKTNKSISVQEDDDSSSEDNEIDEKVDNVKSPNRISQKFNLSTSKSPNLGNSFKNSTINIKSPSVSKMVDEEVQKNKSNTSLNSLGNKSLNNLSIIKSDSESIKGRNTPNNDKRKSLNKSAKRDESMKNDSPKLKNSPGNATFDGEMNCSLKSSQDSNKSKRLSKSFNSSKVNTGIEAAIELTETSVIGTSTEFLAKPNESASRNHSLLLHKKIQSTPEITNLASLFKSLPESSLTLFSESENASKDQGHIALATTDFKVESSNGTNKRKRKDRDETLQTTWSNTAGEFAVVKKMKNHYPTRPISASDSGCTTSFSVISLAKHPKQILKVGNDSNSKFSNFKDEMLYGKRVKREQSSKLFKIQQKLVSKKENFFSR